MKTVKISFSDTISFEPLVEFHQTCIDTLLGKGKELIRFC